MRLEEQERERERTLKLRQFVNRKFQICTYESMYPLFARFNLRMNSGFVRAIKANNVCTPIPTENFQNIQLQMFNRIFVYLLQSTLRIELMFVYNEK